MEILRCRKAPLRIAQLSEILPAPLNFEWNHKTLARHQRQSIRGASFFHAWKFSEPLEYFAVENYFLLRRVVRSRLGIIGRSQPHARRLNVLGAESG